MAEVGGQATHRHIRNDGGGAGSNAQTPGSHGVAQTLSHAHYITRLTTSQIDFGVAAKTTDLKKI